eukprot:2849710-Pyramimonas_sp.AAC.1
MSRVLIASSSRQDIRRSAAPRKVPAGGPCSHHHLLHFPFPLIVPIHLLLPLPAVFLPAAAPPAQPLQQSTLRCLECWPM